MATERNRRPRQEKLKMSGSVLVKVHERDAIPVRAIPRITNWAISPDRLSRLLQDDTSAWPDNPDNSGRRRAPWLTAYLLQPDGQIRKIAPWEWDEVVLAVKGFDSRLHATQHDKADGDSVWRRDAMSYFPPAVFVWRDEFEARALNLNADEVFWPSEDWTPIYMPILLGDARKMLLAGFEALADQVTPVALERNVPPTVSSRVFAAASVELKAPMHAKERGKKGGDLAQAHNRVVREQILRAYQSGATKEKNKAAPALATQFKRAERTVRDLLSGVDWIGPDEVRRS